MKRLAVRFERATKPLLRWWREREDRGAYVDVASLLILSCVIGGVIGGVQGPHWLVGLVLGAVGGLSLLGMAKLAGTMLGRKLDGKPAIPPVTGKQIGAAVSWLFDGARGEGLIMI